MTASSHGTVGHVQQTPPAPGVAKHQREKRLRDYLRRALGPAVFGLFADDDVTEIYRNPHERRVRVDTRTRGKVRTELELRDGAVLEFLSTVATQIGVEFGRAHPQLQAELPEEDFCGARLQGFCPPLTTAPAMVVRKPAQIVYALASYVENGYMTERQRDVICRGVAEQDNILVIGGTGSGKTTLTNAIIKEITAQFPGERLVILEDTRELQSSAADRMPMKTAEGHGLANLVKSTLRTSPDRIIVGECRDEAALHMMDAWSTGHPGGVCTLHASTVRGALERLDRLSQRAGVPPQQKLVGEAVDLVIHIKGGNRAREVVEIARVRGVKERCYLIEPAGRGSSGSTPAA